MNYIRKVILIAIAQVFTLMVMSQQRPNIILFVVDDMGWMDTSEPFGDSIMPSNKKYYTPSMERLAREGVKFTSAYSTPVCTPSRVSMMTGVNAARHRVTNWTSIRRNTPTDHKDSMFIAPRWNFNGLSPKTGVPNSFHALALPQLLKDAGYFTVHVGKAHFGSAGTPGASPYNLGFMVNISGSAIGHPQSYYGKENFGNMPGRTSLNAVQDLMEYYGTDTFLTEALTLEAIKAITQPAKTGIPFFLHLSHYAVHDPIQGDHRFLQKYLDAGIDTIEARYASLVEGMDKSLGDIMDYLEREGLEKNTVLIFMSDNGGLSYTPPRGGKAHTQNLPLKAGKGSVYEGGIRVPMLVKWPGKSRSDFVAKQYVIAEDIFPSILEMAAVISTNLVQPVDGKSFVEILKNEKYKDLQRALIWHIPNKWQPVDGPGINFRSAIRQGNWKLIYNMRDGSCELYDLKNDPGEKNDLALKHPSRAKSLAKLLSKRLLDYNAQMPVIRSTGRPVPLPDQAR